MKRAAFLLLITAAAAFSQTSGGGRLPRVLVIGDSISIGYTEPLKKILAGQYEIAHNPENGGPTSNGITHIAQWLGDGHWDVITFNFGLHDLKLDTGPHQVEIPQYEENLKTILAALHKTGARLIWVTTTPVPTGHLNPRRERADVPVYNDAAAHVVKGQVDAVCDLYAAVLPREAELQQKENVHFTPEGYEFLAEQVAAAIRAQAPR